RHVPLADKQGLVDDVFRRVARRYDLMNDLMSGGLHRAWKDALVTEIDPPRQPRAFHLLDVAGGTGDVAFRVLDAAGSRTRATVLDPSPEMLQVGRERAGERGVADAVSFVVGNAEPYRYLVESIRRFPTPDAFAGMLRGAGFRRVSHRRMTGGIVALHSGWRL